MKKMKNDKDMLEEYDFSGGVRRKYAKRYAAGSNKEYATKERKMGTFQVGAMIANHLDRKKTARVPKLLVDTGSEHTWLSKSILEKIGVKREKKDISFMMANGTVVTRNIGFAIIHIDKYFTIDEVVFAEKGDLTILGARTLEGLNLTVHSAKKKLVAAGPIPAA
jgi:predicted aspartyl protease